MFEPLGMLGPLVVELPISAPSWRDGELESKSLLNQKYIASRGGPEPVPLESCRRATPFLEGHPSEDWS